MLNEIIQHIKKSNNILFITGAGISAESGLPTYRGIGGLYNNQFTEDGVSIEDALSGQMMKQRPELTWKYLHHIETSCRSTKFNEAHKIIAEVEQYKSRVCVLTQNIDGFHKNAGTKNLIEIHGNIYHLFCTNTNCNYKITLENYASIDIPPICNECSSMIRPNVVLFGELLPVDKVNKLTEELTLGFDMIFTIGTTSVFPYIAQPILEASQKGIPTVEINPAESEVSSFVQYKIKDKATKILKELFI